MVTTELEKPFIDAENKRKLFPISEKELVAILHAGCKVNAAFGMSGTALIWNDGEPVPGCVSYLMLLRGISNQNMGGAGI